jgi:hypothetical protein
MGPCYQASGCGAKGVCITVKACVHMRTQFLQKHRTRKSLIRLFSPGEPGHHPPGSVPVGCAVHSM